MDPSDASALAERIDAVLPQTQCGRCGYPACRPYAEAVARGESVNRCPPGGEATLARMAAIAGRPLVPLDPARGAPGVLARAVIEEPQCIGCTLCLEACPVDAIIGGPKRMHGVLGALCSGCELCVPVCPVDCIVMVPLGRAWSAEDARAARERHAVRAARRSAAKESGAPRQDMSEAPDSPSSPQSPTFGERRLTEPRAAVADDPRPASLSAQARQEAVAAALHRARTRRGRA